MMKFNFIQISLNNMRCKIWRILTQILSYQEELAEKIKPFFENLKKNSIQDCQNTQLLKTFSKNQLKFLYKNKILTEEQINSLPFRDKNFFKFSSRVQNGKIEDIIGCDNVDGLQELFNQQDISTFTTITTSFKEVEEIKIPLIQYCIMKKAIECFKYLLVNGFDDPKRTMEEQNDNYIENQYRYEWDCLATAIYYGNKVIIKILEERGIEKGKNAAHIEAAILSYGHSIVKELIDDMDEIYQKNQGIDIFKKGLFASSKNNNIKGLKMLIQKGVDINAKDSIYHIN